MPNNSIKELGSINGVSNALNEVKEGEFVDGDSCKSIANPTMLQKDIALVLKFNDVSEQPTTSASAKKENENATSIQVQFPTGRNRNRNYRNSNSVSLSSTSSSNADMLSEANTAEVSVQD